MKVHSGWVQAPGKARPGAPLLFHPRVATFFPRRLFLYTVLKKKADISRESSESKPGHSMDYGIKLQEKEINLLRKQS